jgi:hypothetical protein
VLSPESSPPFGGCGQYTGTPRPAIYGINSTAESSAVCGCETWHGRSDVPIRARIVQKDLDIAEYTDNVNNPMIPHVIVLAPGLVVYKIYCWFFGRPTLEELRQDLRAATAKCRAESERKGQWAPTPLRYSCVRLILSVLIVTSRQ